MPQPSVSILLPVLNEAGDIEDSLRSLLDQDYPQIVEILIADGGSTDGTLETIERMQSVNARISVSPNPERRQSYGLNLLIEAATGEVVVRADGHTTYAPDYVSQAISALHHTGAQAVGGPMIGEGSTAFQRAVSSAMSAPWAIGPARYRQRDHAGPVDAVYLGVFPRRVLLEAGGFRHFPSGVAEDADLFHRLRESGGSVVLDPSIRSRYRPRTGPWRLLRQFWRYGRGKAEMMWAHGRLPSWRPVAPGLLVVALIATWLGGLVTGRWWEGPAFTALWLGSLLIAAGRSGPLVAGVAALMQLGYGSGLLVGILRGPGAVRRHLATMGGMEPPRDPAADDGYRQPQHGDEGQ